MKTAHALRATSRQIAAIHAESKRCGLDESARRDLMQSVTGKRSAGELDEHEAQAVVRRLKALSGGARPFSASAPASKAGVASGRYAPVLRALWLAAYNLGAVRTSDDRALIAFVKRQTGMDHTRFLTDTADANRAIVALRAICARHGVSWPQERRPDPLRQKQAVIEAILRRFIQAGVQIDAPRLDLGDAAALDRLQTRLGARLRNAIDAGEAP